MAYGEGVCGGWRPRCVLPLGETQRAPLAHLSRRGETSQRWEDWGGLFLRPNTLSYASRTLHVRKNRAPEIKQNSRVLKISSLSSPCALRPSPQVPGILRTPPTLKHRALLAHAILLPKGPDLRKELRRLGPEGLPPVDVHLSSADQIPFAVARYRCGWVATRGVRGSVGGNMLPMR